MKIVFHLTNLYNVTARTSRNCDTLVAYLNILAVFTINLLIIHQTVLIHIYIVTLGQNYSIDFYKLIS